MKLHTLCAVIVVIISCLFSSCFCFHFHGPQHRTSSKRALLCPTMKWSFSSANPMAGGQGDRNSLTGVDGEYYFHPSRQATIKAPPDTCGNAIVIPIFPNNNILVPGASETINVFEMRNRQLFNDLPNDIFGMSFYSPQQQKLSLVGILAKITQRKLVEDGRVSAVVEGYKRFYVEQIIAEKPYLTAKVRTFTDYTEVPDLLDPLEWKIYDQIKKNIKMIEVLYPQKNFTETPMLLQNRPLKLSTTIRTIKTSGDEHDLARRSQFSFAVIDMLQIPPSLKLSLMQEHVLERRLAKSLRILENGAKFIRDNIITKGILTEEQLTELEAAATLEAAKGDANARAAASANWYPENFVNGEWVQAVTMM